MADPTAPTTPATSTATPAAAPAAAQGAAAQAQSAQPPAAQVIPPALAAMLPQASAAQAPAAGAQAPAQQAAAPAAAQPAAAQPPAQTAAEPPKKSADEQVAELRQQLATSAVRTFVAGVANEAGAHSADQVVKLLADELDALPDGRVIVKNDPRADAKQHIAKFLAANLNLLKPTVPSGGVGTPAAVGAPAAAVTIDPKTRDGGTAVVRNFLGNLFPQPAPPPGGAAGAR